MTHMSPFGGELIVGAPVLEFESWDVKAIATRLGVGESDVVSAN